MNENPNRMNMRSNLSKLKKIAFWTITPEGARLAETLRKKTNQATLFVPKVQKNDFPDAINFESFRVTLSDVFHKFDGHVFFMATGIVVRMISFLIRHKTIDPAVVVMDERGNHCISLLSGHIGGANELAQTFASLSGANPVITTATDINQVLAIDLLASENGMYIENPDCIKKINMAFLQRKSVWVYDPYCFFDNLLKQQLIIKVDSIQEGLLKVYKNGDPMPGVIVDDQINDVTGPVLILRPPTLAVGLGCNRHTEASEIINLFKNTLQREQLAITSVFLMASIDLKSNEPGIIESAEKLKIPLRFFDSESLNTVKSIQNPSEIVRQHIGVNSVCEAASILAANRGKLIVPKQKSKNTTIAIARTSCM